MPIMYKLTTQDMMTHGKMKWEVGKKNTAKGKGNAMCTDGVLHCYSDPVLAIIFNPQHANIKNPRLFEIECSTILATDGLKSCSKSQTIIKELEVPKLSTEQLVAFAIKAALLVYKCAKFKTWAENWLSGVDRTSHTAYAAHAAADYAAYAADRAAARAAAHAGNAAAYAGNAAAHAAYAAAYAARAADYANAADYTDRAADYANLSAANVAANVAAYAARAAYAANAAANVANADIGVNFKPIANWVISNIK